MSQLFKLSVERWTVQSSELQERIVSQARVVIGLFVIIAFLIGVGWVAGLIFMRTSSATIPVVLGLFISMIVRPLVNLVEDKLPGWMYGGKRLWAVVLVGIAAILLFLGLVYLVGCYVVDQVSQLYSILPQWVDSLADRLDQPESSVRKLLEALGFAEVTHRFIEAPWDVTCAQFSRLVGRDGALAQGVQTGFLHYLSSVGSWLMTLVFCFVFLMTEVRIRPFVRKVIVLLPDSVVQPSTMNFLIDLGNRFCKIMVKYFSKQVGVCVLEGVYFGFFFMIVGLPHGFILGFLQGLMNFVPFIGTVACLPILIVASYFGGGVQCLLAVGVVWGFGQVLDGFVLPNIVHGKEAKLPPWLVLFSFMFWGAAFNSVLGMMLAIPITAFVKSVWTVLQKRINSSCPVQ